MRYLVTHPRRGVVATAPSLQAATLARNTISDEWNNGNPSGRDAYAIVGPLPGDPDDPDTTIRKAAR